MHWTVVLLIVLMQFGRWTKVSQFSAVPVFHAVILLQHNNLEIYIFWLGCCLHMSVNDWLVSSRDVDQTYILNENVSHMFLINFVLYFMQKSCSTKFSIFLYVLQFAVFGAQTPCYGFQVHLTKVLMDFFKQNFSLFDFDVFNKGSSKKTVFRNNS